MAPGGLGAGPSPLGDMKGPGLSLDTQFVPSQGSPSQTFFRPSDEVAKTADLLASNVEAYGKGDPGSRLLLELLQQQLQWALSHPTFVDLSGEEQQVLREMDAGFGAGGGAGATVEGADDFDGLDLLEEWQRTSMFQYEARCLDGA